MQWVRGPEPVPVASGEHLTSTLWRRAGDAEEIAVHHDGQRWTSVTWRELADRVEAVAAGLIAHGIAPGAAVGIMSATRLDWTIADLAILSVGAVTVPIYETDSPRRCARILADAEVALVLAEHGGLAERVAEAREHVDWDGEVLVIDDGALEWLAGRASDADRAEVDRRRAAISADDVASIVYTSGTTGTSKGCVLTHRNLLWTVRQSLVAVEAAFRNPDASTVLFLPLAHVFTRLVQFGCLEQGVSVAYARSLRSLRDDLPELQPTFLLTVPRVLEKLYDGARAQAGGWRRAVFDAADRAAVEAGTATEVGPLLRLRLRLADALVYRRLREAVGGRLEVVVSGGSPLGARLSHFFLAAGIAVGQGYGLTETSPACTFDQPDDPTPGTVGTPLPGVEIAIADDGEVCVRGENVFAGYHRDPEATAEVVDDDGWLRTGDLGELDERGSLWITGRKKELIVTAGGKNVAPEPLEEAIRAHRLVSQAVVVGDDRPFVAALVTLDEDALAAFAEEEGLGGDAADLRAHARVREEVARAVEAANATVSRAESIREFRILERDLHHSLDELTPTMKPRRGQIAEHFADDVAALYT
ncbi:MAG: AMP-dependent synthetase/ligase [Egibacteraceae bacterium]